LLAQPEQGAYDAVILAVAHDQFRKLGAGGARAFGKPQALLYDIKSLFPREDVDGRL
jgi:UDP-N-acetyl-D-galactosamine dehydrogenase